MGSKLNLSMKQSIAIGTTLTGNVTDAGTEAVRVNGPLIFSIFTAHKRSLRRLCFYTCLSFCPHWGGGGGVCGRGVCMAGGHVWQGGVCGGGCAWQGGMHATHAAPRHHEIRSVNTRAVRILLECILVQPKYEREVVNYPTTSLKHRFS